MNATTINAKSIQDQITDLRALKTIDLAALYQELHGRPPHVRHKEWLWKRIAWKLQEQRFGGLSGVAQRRLEERIAEIDLPADEATRRVTGKLRKPVRKEKNDEALGTVLTREWHGTTITVTKTNVGWEYRGGVFRSLSAIAKAITGTKWNGKLFFGITERKAKR